jgi:cell wall-associated NlpC family hydrolase
MRRGCIFPWLAALVALAGLLQTPTAQADPTPTPTPHKKKHRVTGSADDSGATSSPSPTPGRSKKHPAQHTADEDGPSTPAASAAAKSDAGFHPPSDDKPAGSPSASPAPSPAATSTIEASELRDFDTQPAPVRNLLNAALDLTRRHLTYTYGSADPANGGLDCSGAIYYLLKAAGFDDVPRSASEQYAWVRRQSRFYAVLSKKEDSFELAEMRPGDLLFWTGTYHVDHDPPVTHTMLYLGRRKQDGKPLMFGASDGRPYDGQRRNGVSVFDFKMPAARSADSADANTAAAPDHSPDFAGYGPIPGMAERNDAASRQAAPK